MLCNTGILLLQVTTVYYRFPLYSYGNLKVHVSNNAGPPSKPQPIISYSEEGMFLRVSWNESYSHSEFPVTYYTVQTTSTIDPSNYSQPVNISHRLDYIDSVDFLPTVCYELEYNVTAFNEIGPSAVGSVTGAFPISELIATDSFAGS